MQASLAPILAAQEAMLIYTYVCLPLAPTFHALQVRSVEVWRDPVADAGAGALAALAIRGFKPRMFRWGYRQHRGKSRAREGEQVASVPDQPCWCQHAAESDCRGIDEHIHCMRRGLDEHVVLTGPSAHAYPLQAGLGCLLSK